MAKSGFVVGGIVGATVAILLFAFIVIPSENVGTPELITSNGHDTTILGDETSYTAKGNLNLVQLFEKSEAGVVKIGVQRGPDGPRDTPGMGSGFVYDNLGHIITNAHVVEGASKATVTFLDGTANPIPLNSPDIDCIAVLIPITSPFIFNNGPPEFPGFIAASV